MRSMLRRFIRDEEAASAVEYALIAGLIAAALITVLTNLGTGLEAKLQELVTAITEK